MWITLLSTDRPALCESLTSLHCCDQGWINCPNEQNTQWTHLIFRQYIPYFVFLGNIITFFSTCSILILTEKQQCRQITCCRSAGQQNFFKNMKEQQSIKCRQGSDLRVKINLQLLLIWPLHVICAYTWEMKNGESTSISSFINKQHTPGNIGKRLTGVFSYW